MEAFLYMSRGERDEARRRSRAEVQRRSAKAADVATRAVGSPVRVYCAHDGISAIEVDTLAASLVGDFNDWDARAHPCGQAEDGVFEVFVPDAPDQAFS